MKLNSRQKDLAEFLYLFLNISCGVSDPREPDGSFPKGRVMVLQRQIGRMLSKIREFNGSVSHALGEKLDQIDSDLYAASILLGDFGLSGEKDKGVLSNIDAKLRAAYSTASDLLNNW